MIYFSSTSSTQLAHQNLWIASTYHSLYLVQLRLKDIRTQTDIIIKWDQSLSKVCWPHFCKSSHFHQLELLLSLEKLQTRNSMLNANWYHMLTWKPPYFWLVRTGQREGGDDKLGSPIMPPLSAGRTRLWNPPLAQILLWQCLEIYFTTLLNIIGVENIPSLLNSKKSATYLTLSWSLDTLK